jgi:hypothetical protein
VQFTLTRDDSNPNVVLVRAKKAETDAYDDEPYKLDFSNWNHADRQEPLAALDLPGVSVADVMPLVHTLNYVMTEEDIIYWNHCLDIDNERLSQVCPTCAKFLEADSKNRDPPAKKRHKYSDAEIKELRRNRKEANEALQDHLEEAGQNHRRNLRDWWFPPLPGASAARVLDVPVAAEANISPAQEQKIADFPQVEPAPPPVLYNGRRGVPDLEPLKIGDLLFTLPSYSEDFAEEQKRDIELSKVTDITDVGIEVQYWGAAARHYKRLAHVALHPIIQASDNKPWTDVILHGCTVLLYGFELNRSNKHLPKKVVTQLKEMPELSGKTSWFPPDNKTSWS